MASTKLLLTSDSTPPKSPQNSPKKAQKFFALIIFASPFEKKCVFVFFWYCSSKVFPISFQYFRVPAQEPLESQLHQVSLVFLLRKLLSKVILNSSRNFLSHFVFFALPNVFLAEFYLKKFNDNFSNAFS